MKRTRDELSIALASFLVFGPEPTFGSESIVQAAETTPIAVHFAESDAPPISPENVLHRAFVNQYNVDTTSKIKLVMHNRAGQMRTRRFEAVQKIIDNRVHSIGRLLYPSYLRNMAILQIEEVDHSHNAFVYLPSMNRSRRVSTHQRGDSFFGTDVTYEDLERRHSEDYKITDFRTGELRGEPVFVIRALPLHHVSYSEIVFHIAKKDHSILQTECYKRESKDPYRTLRVHRSSMITLRGHTLGTRITIENRVRGTRTEVTVSELKINPEIDNRLFSVRTLEQQRDLDLPF